MGNPFKRKALTNEQVDKLLKKYMVELPAELEEEANRGLQRMKEEQSSENNEDYLKKVIKARVDLQLAKEQFEKEKMQFAKARRRNRKVKVLAGVCAMLAVVILLPMTSQSAKGLIRDIKEEIFPEEDEVMVFPEDMGDSTWDEDEAWAYIKDAIYAKRMYFDHLGDEWCFGKGIYDGPLRIKMEYGYQGEDVFLSVGMRNGQTSNTIATPGGSRIDEQTFVGDKDSRIRMYCYESEEGILQCGAEIVYENALYLVRSSVDYDDFQKIIKGITFEE